MNNMTKNAQKFKGKVVSAGSTLKTVVVLVERYVKHPKYQKYFRRSKKYSASDEKNEFKIGDSVVIESTRPVSKTKKWVVKSKE